MSRVLTINTSSVGFSNPKAIEAGAAVIQCGPKWLFISAISSPIDSGVLIELDEFSGELKRVYNSNHTIATGVPYPITHTNNGITSTTSMDNSGNIFMYVNYSSENPKTIFRGTWNETLLRFENFVPFASFASTGGSGTYNTMVWDRFSSIYLLTTSGYVGRINAFTANSVTMEFKNFSGVGWSPSSYSFSNGYANSGRYLVGKSGTGTNWYSIDANGSSSQYVNPDSSYYANGFLYGVSGIYTAFTAHLCHFSNFHKRMYYITNSTVYAYLFDSQVFTTTRYKAVPTKQIRESKKIIVPVSEPTSIVTSGRLELNINSDAEVLLNTRNSRPYDVISSTKYLFTIYNDEVDAYDKNLMFDKDYIPITKKWSEQFPDTRNVLGQANPTAYTIVTVGAKDYFVGIHPSTSTIYSWEISSEGDLINQTNYGGVSNFSYYGRAAWDGGSYVYFIKSNGAVYRWTVNTSSITTLTSINTNNIDFPSYTGCGAIARDNLLYISNSLNSARKFKLFVFDISNSVYKTAIRESQLRPSDIFSSPTVLLFHNFQFAVNIGASGSMSLHPIKWLNIDNFSTTSPPLKQTLEAYDAIPYSLRTLGNKTIGPLQGKTTLSLVTSDSILKIFFGRYIYVYMSNHTVYIYNKNPDGTIGSLYTTTRWVDSMGGVLTNNINANFPITMYTENNVDKVVFFNYVPETSTGGTTLYEMILNSSGGYSTNTDYSHNSGVNTYTNYGFTPGHAAWDGSRYVYFINRFSIWRWDTSSKSNSLTLIKTITHTINISIPGQGFVDADNFYYSSANGSMEKIPLQVKSLEIGQADDRLAFFEIEKFFDFYGDYVAFKNSAMVSSTKIFVNPQHPNLMFVVPENSFSSNKNIYYVDCTLRKEIVPLDVEIHNNIAKRENLLNVRDKVNEFRVNNGLSARSWTDPNIVAGLSPIKAVHWNEITEAIDEVYSTQKISYNTPSVASKIQETIIPKTPTYRITDLRSRLLAIIKALKNG